MKKILTITLLLLQQSVFGQTYTTSPYQTRDINAGWYNIGKLLEANHGNSTLWDNTMFPEQGLTTGGVTWEAWKSASGQTFDPFDPIWDAEVPNTSLGLGSSYMVDTVSIAYAYYRFQQDAPDTLVVQVYIEDSMVTNNAGAIPYTVPYYDATKKIGQKATQTFVILLSNADTTALDEKRYLNIPINQYIASDQSMAVSVVYLPGNTYSMGDTLAFDSNFLPTNKRNTLALFTFYDENTLWTTDGYNHGLLKDNSGEVPQFMNLFRPGTLGWEPIILYSDMYFHVSETVSIAEHETNGLINCYPNPTHDELNIEVDPQLAYSNYRITNQLGQTIQLGQLDEFVTSVSLGNLQNGFYYIHFEQGPTIKVIKH